MTETGRIQRPLELSTRPCVGMTVNTKQSNILDFTRLYLRYPVLIVMEAGNKRVRWQGGECLLRSGEAIVIAGNQSIDIVERQAEGCEYLSYWLIVEESLISEFSANSPPGITPLQAAVPLGLLSTEIRAACERARHAVESHHLPLEIAKHRLQEVLWWLRHLGVVLQTTSTYSITDRVRATIAAQPSLDWNSRSLAATLAMSEATLRRKLAAEDTSFSEVLLDVRMSHAILLLQTTPLSITRIAQDVGYGSPSHSHFTQRFRQRFGFLPSAIREAASNAEV